MYNVSKKLFVLLFQQRLNLDWQNNKIKRVKNEIFTPLFPDEIQHTNQVGPHYKNGSPGPVIVKFLSYKSYREKVFRAASKLPMAGEKLRGVFINEDLTKDRSKVFSIATQLKKCSDIQDCWTHDGVIFIRDFKAATRAFDNASKCLQWIKRTMDSPPM